MNQGTEQSWRDSEHDASDHVRINLYTFPEATFLMQDAYWDKKPFRAWTLKNDVYWYHFCNHLSDPFFAARMWEDVGSENYKRYWESNREVLKTSWEKSPVVLQHDNAFMFWPNPNPISCQDVTELCMRKFGMYFSEKSENYQEAVAYYEKISEIQGKYIRQCDLQIFLMFNVSRWRMTLHEDVMRFRLAKRARTTKNIFLAPLENTECSKTALREKFPDAIVLSEWEDWLFGKRRISQDIFRSDDVLLPMLMDAVDKLKIDYLRDKWDAI